MASEASAASGKILDAVKAVEAAQGESKSSGLEKLKLAVTGYLKQSKNAIEMADGDAGSALMFIKGAERSFAEIDKLTDELTASSNDSRDREIARAKEMHERVTRNVMKLVLRVDCQQLRV